MVDAKPSRYTIAGGRRLAMKSAKSPLSEHVHAGAVRRKSSPNKLVVGCVMMRSQTMIIRVFYFKQLRPQRVWKFHYEAMSTDGGDFAKADRIYGDQLSRHSVLYEVRVNDDTKNPRIPEVIREIVPSDVSEKLAATLQGLSG